MTAAFLPALEQAIFFLFFSTLTFLELHLVVLIFFLILYLLNFIFIGCCSFFNENPMCQTNSVFMARISFILDILINSLLHLLRITFLR